MALTALDLIEHPELLAAIKEEHRKNVAAQAEYGCAGLPPNFLFAFR